MIKEECTESEAAAKAEIRMAVKQKCNEFMELAERQECIGEGTFGEVWTMKLKRERSPLLVQKIYKCVDDLYGTKMEAWILSGFRNTKYIPKLLYAGYTHDGKWCTIMEYFTGGTLDYHIREEIKRYNDEKELRITPKQKKYIAYHLALGIEKLHRHLYSHG